VNLKKIKGWIFDNDGLLQDTEPDYEWSFCDMARTFGRPEPSRELLMKVKGLDLKEVARLMIEGVGLPLPGYAEFKTELDKRLFQRAPYAEMMPGATELIKHLHEPALLAVATSSTKEILVLKTKNHTNIYSMFNSVVSGDDPEVKKGKPAPDLLLVSSKRIGVPPSECAYVGDNPVDVQAAIAAGILPVAVPSAGRNLSEFSDALHIFSNLGMLLQELKT